MELCAIGKIVSDRSEHQWDGWRDCQCIIDILPQYAEGLEGIEDVSHIIVIYAMDNVGTIKMKVTPQGKDSSPNVGIFATRCPWRPTPVGVTAVRLLGVEGNVLNVEGLDAIDGAEVFDVKPYWPEYDAVEDCSYPPWVDDLEF
jgi:tRNA-Thr(GGU) m(6)t(6)A37 methyltransferase TsaA